MKRRVDLFLGGKPLKKRHVTFLIVFVLNNLGQKLTKLAVGSVGLGIFTLVNASIFHSIMIV